MRLQPWLLTAVIAVAITAMLFGVHYYRHRYVRGNSDISSLLPPGDLNLIYVDVGALRKAELLGLLRHIQIAPDKEYADFIRETGFDYTRDLEAIVIANAANEIFLVGRGQFQWNRLKEFAVSHQGLCEADSCRVPATVPGRWVDFVNVQSDVLAVAISPNPAAADALRPPGRRLQGQIPKAPVWAKLSHSLLTNPVSLPLPVQIFLISMQSAESVTLSLGTGSLQLNAQFANVPTADTARRQLEIQTKTLVSALARNNEKYDRASLASLLAEGSFRVMGSDVLGIWPIHPELIRALQ